MDGPPVPGRIRRSPRPAVRRGRPASRKECQRIPDRRDEAIGRPRRHQYSRARQGHPPLPRRGRRDRPRPRWSARAGSSFSTRKRRSTASSPTGNRTRHCLTPSSAAPCGRSRRARAAEKCAPSGRWWGCCGTTTRYAEAEHLERLWNTALAGSDFCLYCAYGIDLFDKLTDTAALNPIVAAHTHLSAGPSTMLSSGRACG